jgi:hypothetical protein
MTDAVATTTPALGLADYFKFGLKVLDGLLPLASIALMFVPGGQIPAAGLKVFQNLPNIIALAERIFGDGTGEQKKNFVIQTAQAVVGSIASVSTGGQAETWDKIGTVIGPAIDQMVTVINTFQTIPQNSMQELNKTLGG